MKISLKEMEVTLSQEEATGPIGQMFSGWVEKVPNSKDTCLLPTHEIAQLLEVKIDTFRGWLAKDQRLQKIAYLRDGTVAPLKSRASKYFRLSEVRTFYAERKRPRIRQNSSSPSSSPNELIGASP